jgi:hypothetical protein
VNPTRPDAGQGGCTVLRMGLTGGAFLPYTSTGIQPGEDPKMSPEMRLLEVGQARAALDRHRHGTRQSVALGGALILAATLALSLGAPDALQLLLVLLTVIQGGAIASREAREGTLRREIDAAERHHLAAELTRHQRDLEQAERALHAEQEPAEPEQPEPVEEPPVAGPLPIGVVVVGPDPGAPPPPPPAQMVVDDHDPLVE